MSQSIPIEKFNGKVQETERNESPPPASIQRPRHFWEKLGWYNIAVLTIGSGVVAVAVAFLCFLWITAMRARHGKTYPDLWFWIAENDWMPKTVTLCAVLIRIATAAQLGVFAAIIAAVILERVGVPTEDLPKMSMIRALNSGPHSLVMSSFNSAFNRALIPYTILVFLAILNAFTLQFTSTLLLTDFNKEDVPRQQPARNVTYGIDSDANFSQTSNTYGGIDHWKSSPASYPMFAEYKEPEIQGANFVDTGKTLRGFLPFREPEQRLVLRSYNGPMTIVDTRVICFKPTISNIIVKTDGVLSSISVTVGWKDTHPDIMPSEGFKDEGYKIRCPLPTSDYFGRGNYWPLSLCTYGTGIVRLLGGIIPDTHDSSMPTGHTSMSLLLHVTGNSTQWNQTISEENELQPVQSSDAVWTSLAREDVGVNITACLINPLPADYLSVANRDGDFPDVELGYTRTKGFLNTTNVRKAFGVYNESLTPEKRGIFQLQPVSNWTDESMKSKFNKSSRSFLWEASLRPSLQSDDEAVGAGDTSFFTEDCPPVWSTHRAHVAIFQHIFQSTKNPALALQGLWTILLQMAYYDFLPEYDLNHPAITKSTILVDIPMRMRAFFLIMGLLLMHFVLVLIAVILFLTRTEMSLLGNAWQAVSQVMSTDTANVVHRGATETDGEVKGSMKQSGIADSRVRITKCVNSGRAEATAVRQRHGATYSAPMGHA